MRIMTFNIKFENDNDKENSWHNRRDLVVRLVQRYSPAIVGTQEGTWNQLLYLKNTMPDYALYAPGRVIDDISQYPTLFYQKKSYAAEGGGDFWLSKTPDVHLSKDWDSAFPRMMSYGFFLDEINKKRFLAVVTHLDHKVSKARWHQAKIISRFIQNHTGPVILMGDFNDTPGSSVHQILCSSASGLRDTWELLERREGEQSMTHHGFLGVPHKTRMDWIVVSKHFRVLDAQIIRDNRDGSYPSDHYPYAVDLEWI